jgi:hypothetical protein
MTWASPPARNESVLMSDFQHATAEAAMDLLNDLKAGVNCPSREVGGRARGQAGAGRPVKVRTRPGGGASRARGQA